MWWCALEMRLYSSSIFIKYRSCFIMNFLKKGFNFLYNSTISLISCSGLSLNITPLPVSSQCKFTLKIEEISFIIRMFTFLSPRSIKAIYAVATDICSANSFWVSFNVFRNSASRSFGVMAVVYSIITMRAREKEEDKYFIALVLCNIY